MTKEDWLTAVDPCPMLVFLGDEIGNQKLQQFAAACCRRYWHLLTDARSRKALIAFEEFTDGKQSAAKLQSHVENAAAAVQVAQNRYRTIQLGWATAWTLHAQWEAAIAVVQTIGIAGDDDNIQLIMSVTDYPDNLGYTYRCMCVARGLQDVCRDLARVNATTHAGDWTVAQNAEMVAQAQLLRCIAGNPFQPPPKPVAATANVTALAQAMYDGLDNAPILADALEESGQLELAEHFREQPAHPIGCWAVELLRVRQ